MFRKLTLSTVAALVVAAAAVTSASALAPVSSTFDATARVPTNCTFTNGSFGAIAFGDYDPLGANATAGVAGDVQASTTLSVKCTKGTAPTISLGAGNNGFTDPSRFMKSANNVLLAYKLTQPSAALNADSGTTWKPSDNFQLPTSTGRGTAINFPVYGHLAGGQDVETGDYSDTVQATVNY